MDTDSPPCICVSSPSLHQLPPDVASILALFTFLAVPFRPYGVGGRNVGSVCEAGGQPKHAPEVFILSLTRL
jgi:hypothetical protein